MSTTQQDQLRTFLKEVLQISGEQFPPNYYQLLGLEAFESDEAKIKQQARRQVQLIRDRVSPDNERIAKVAVHNIGKAKTCLLDPSARRAYELKLGSSRKPRPAGKTKRPAGKTKKSRAPEPTEYRLSPPDDLPQSSKRQLTGASPSSKPLPSVSLAAPASRTGSQSGVSPQLIYVGLGAGLVLLLAVIAIAVLTMRSPDATVETADAPSASKPSSAAAPPPPLGVSSPEDAAEKEEVNEDAAAAAPVEPAPPPPEPRRVDNLQNPFELLPLAVVLPPIEQVRTDLVDAKKNALKLGELHDEALDVLSLEIDPAAASLPADREFSLVAVESSEHDNEWHCALTRTAEAAANAASALGEAERDASLIIARIYRDGRSLFFEWSNLATGAVAGQLRNSKLACTSGDHRHEMRLRPIQVQDPHLLDFTEPNQIIALVGESFPEEESLFLEFVGLVGFSGQLEQIPDDGRSSVGDTIRLRPDGWYDAEIRLRLRASSEQPELVISAFAEIGGRWRPITTEIIRDKLADLQKTLERNKQKLKRTRTLQARLVDQRKKVSATSTRNPTQENAKRVELRKIDKQLKSYSGTIERLGGTIPKTLEQIQRLDMLAKVGNRIHQTVRLRVRVYAMSETGEFDLLHLGRVQNADQQRI